jgi:hypothetical protein
MGEDVIDSQFPNSDSAASQFNNLIQAAIQRNKGSNIGVLVADADAQIFLQDLLTRPSFQDLLRNIKRGPYYTVDMVSQVRQVGNQIQVQHLGLDGFFRVFEYQPDDPKFKDAPEGFYVGDIILNKYYDFMKIESVKPIHFSPKTTENVLTKFLQIIEGKRESEKL